MAKAAVRRLMAELRELTPTNSSEHSLFHAHPLENDIFEWHFSIRGPTSTPFEGGTYHGRILLPPDYPLKAPEIILLTPNGRFEVGKRICLSVTSHHQETWQPSWGIRTILTALIAFMPSRAEGVGALDYPNADRRRLAKLSGGWQCDRCGVVCGQVLQPVPEGMEVGGIGVGDEVVRELLGEGKKPKKSTGGEASSSATRPSTEGEAGRGEADASSSCEHPERQHEQAELQQPEQQLPEHQLPEQQLPETQLPETQILETPLLETQLPEAQQPEPQLIRTQQLVETQARETQSAPRPMERPRTQERELLYLAYAIVGLIVAVILRRFFRLPP